MKRRETHTFETEPPQAVPPPEPGEMYHDAFNHEHPQPTHFTAPGTVLKIHWESPSTKGPRVRHLPVRVDISIPAEQLVGLDITRPITITQEDS